MPAKDFDAFLDSVLSGESEQPGTVSPQATLSFDDMVSSVLDKSQKLSNTGLPQSEAMDFFQSKGWTKEHAAGIVGNLYHESAGMQPEVLGDGNKSFGLAQWNGPRREALFQYATSKNERIPSFQTQLEFVQKELEESPVNGADALRRARTVEEAAKVFSDMYERPGKPMLASRIKYANEIYNGYDGQSTGASPSSSKIAVTPPPIGGTQSDFENWTYQTVAQHAPGFAAMVRPPKSRVDLTSTSASDFDAMVSSVLDTGPQKKGEGEYDFWEGMKALGHGFLQIPREMVASGIQAVKGSEGVHTGEAQDWMDKYLEWNKEKSKEFSKKYGGPASFLPGIPLDEVAQLPQNLGYMAFITMVGLPVGMGASVIGTPAAGWVTGMAATGSAAYRMTTYQVAERLRDFFNELSVKDRGKQMSEEEWIPVRAKYEDYIRAYGLWEAIPEAVGSALELKIISAPGKALTNKIASVLGMPEIKNRFLQILPKVTSFYGTELATEAWTQHEQGRIESEIGMRESPPTWGEALKEVAPQVVLQSTVVGGAGHIGNKVYNRATGKQTDEVNRDITGGNAPASPEDQALIDKLNTALGQTAGTGEAGGAVPAGQTPEERLRALVPPEGAPGGSVPGAIPVGGVTNVKADSPFYSVLPAVKEDIPGAAPEMNKPTAKPTTLLDTIEGLNIPEEQKAALVDGLKAKSRETESQFQQTLSQMMDMPSRSAAEAKRVREAAAVPEEDKAAQAEPGKTAQAGLGEPGSGGVGKEQSKSLLPSEKLPEKSAEESAAVFLEDINTMQSPAGRQLLLERLAREAAVQSRQESEATQGTQAIQEEAKKEASIPPKSEEKFIGQKAERTTDKLVQDLKAAVITPDTKAKTQAEVDAEQVAQLRRDLAERKKGTQPASAQVPKVETPVTAATIPAKPAPLPPQTIPPSKPAAPPRRGPSLETLIRKPEPVSVEESLRAKAKAIKEKKKAEKAKPIRPGMRFIRKADNTEWEVYRSYAGTVEIKQVNRNKIGFIPKKSLHNNYSQIYPDLQGKEPTNVSQKEQVQQQEAEAKKEPSAGRGDREGEGEEVKASEIVTDPNKVQEIRNSIAEGEMILKSGKTVSGRKMSEDELKVVQRSVDNANQKLGEPPRKPSEKPTVQDVGEKKDEGAKLSLSQSTPSSSTTKLSAQQVYDAVLPITKKWTNSPEIRVYQSADALPGIVQGKFSSRAEGVFVTMPDGSNFIALIADNLKSGDHAQMVLLHEAVGHFGIRGVLGESDNFNKVLDEVYRMYGRSGMQEIADLYGFDLNTREGQRAASEEQIARIAEKNEKRGILEKVYAVFRDWLRKAGFNLKMTYGDLRKIIADSGKFLEGGGTRNTPAQTTFSFSMQAPIFYSQMERVLLNKLPGSGSPSQMKSMIESWVKKGEFKEEEYKWSGIGEWLDGKQGKIGKQEVLDFLRKNNVQVREVWKGNKEFSNQIKEYEDYFSKLEKKYGESPLTAAISRSEEIELMRLQDQAFPDEPDTKYQQYQLPGGKSYRELLLTLPVKGLTAEDILLRDGSITTQNKNEISSGYQSSHWYEENVLVHVRFNERTDAEGNRILFVEEVQSDWHQEGKRKGYGRKEKYAVFANENAVGEFSSRTEAESALKNAGGVGEILDLSRSGVPPAPFQKTWPELAMKRVLRYAAENGFDRVAWTTGEQQADRYDLSKQVDKIAWAKNDNGKFSITILKEGDIVDLPISTKNITEEKLVDVIGKDIADKIIKSPNGSGVLRGEALKVGGEGMRGFYDKMLPAKMNAYVKKWGAKTETINIGETYQDTSDLTGKTTGRENVPVHSIPITQSMREGVLKGQALFSLSQQKLAKDIETLDRNTKEAIFGRDTDLREVRDSLRIPTWLAKKSEVIKKLLSVQTGRDNKRTSLAHDSLAQTVPAFNLSKKDTATLSKVAFQLEGKKVVQESKFKKVGEYTVTMGRSGDQKTLPVLDLNDAHYDSLEKFLKDQGVRQTVLDAYMGIRRFLDQSQIVSYDRLRNLEKIDPTLIDEFRTSMGNVHNYFPHSRYGNFYIQAIDPKAKQGENAVKYRQHFNALNWRDANRWWAKNKDKIITSLEKENSDVNWRSLEWKGDKVKGLPEEVYDFPIPVDAVQQVLDAAVDRIPVESDEARKALRTALSEESANIMKSRGFGSHMIRRKNIPGFEQNDIKRVLYDYINGFSGWITKIEAAHDFGDVLKDLNARQRPNEYKYAVKYVHDMLQNSTRTDKWVANAKAFFFLNYLGGNLKTAAVNLTQNLVAGVPRLSIETGLTSASYEWTRAMKDIRLSVTERGIANKKNLTADEHRFLKDMFREGWGQSQFIREVSAQVGGAGSQIWQKTVRYMGLPMEIAERYNRLSIGLAAFRAARDGKITNKNTLAEFKIRPGEKAGFDAAKSFAEGVVTDAHFIYGKTNMPAFMRGSAGAKALSSAYTFRTFNHNLLSMWRWMLTSGDRQGKKAFAYSIGSIILLGGLGALPFYNSIASLLRQLFGVDYLGAEVRKLIPDHQRDLVMYGAPSLLGIGIGSSIGMELPIFDKIKSSQNLSEQAFEGIGQLIGIPAAMLKEVLDVVDAVRNGRGDRAWEIVAPTFLKNIMVAHRLSTEGQTTMAGKPINFPGERGARTITDYEAGMKVLGFQPLSSTKSFEVYKTMEDLKAYKDNKLHELANKYMAAKNSGDIEGMAKVREDVRAWNIKMNEEGHPEHKIDLSKSIAARSKTAKPPRAMRGEARELMDLYK